MPGRLAAALVSVVVQVLVPAAAAAQYPAITDRGYTLDLYQGAVLGSSRVVGMGGAQVALAEGSAGMLANPAAAAVRSATSHGTWSLDAHLDTLAPELGSDYDNNGIASDGDDSALVVTGGVVVRRGPWGFAVVATSEQHTTDVGAGTLARPEFTVGHVGVARLLLGRRLAVGLALRTGTFSVTAEAASRQQLVSMAGGSLEAGAVWLPGDLDLRVGGRVALPVLTGDSEPGGCDPLDCGGYILPERVTVPWEAAAGIAWRRAPSRWNRRVEADFRDERALVLAADLVLVGPVADGHGVEAFVRKQLQPSGRDPSLSVRAGAELEWVPGWLRVRGGGYWEPGRFSGVAGRLHATLGVQVRVWSFCFWGERYRLSLTATGDGAAGYGNGGLSIGFWS